MRDQAVQALADFLVAAQAVVLQANGRADALGPLAPAWRNAREALGLSGRWHSRDEALRALRGLASPASSGTQGVERSGSSGDPELDGYAAEGAGMGVEGRCLVCLEPLPPSGVGSCPSCGSRV